MNTKKWGKTGLLWAAVWACSTTLSAQTQPDTWVAQDGLGRSLGSTEQYGEKRDNKTVGLFYVIWHGSHGYDRSTPTLPEEGVMIPTPADSLSPYDNQKLLDANPSNPQYGPVHAFHHWGEPYLGYYVSNDEWVIRKHAQMITDAGVDVIILDVTNAVIYLPTIKTICDTYMKMRAEGSKTPQIAFLFNSSARQTVQRIYDNIYAKGLYKDLWFNYKRVLKQRNMLLKSKASDFEISVWDDLLSSLSEKIDELRRAYLEKLKDFLSTQCEQFLPKFSLKFELHSGWNKDFKLRDLLAQNLEKDRVLGYTFYGCHRADLKIKSDSISAGATLSRGQLKLLVCATIYARIFASK